ncbi:MAG: DUF1989 domain-containing protein, partial [Candidatus Dormibacteria bacterium]
MSTTAESNLPGETREVPIPARSATALELERGTLLEIVDVEGQQVADLIAFN